VLGPTHSAQHIRVHTASGKKIALFFLIFLPLVFFSPVNQETPDGAGAWTNPSLQNYPLKRPPALTPNSANSPAVKRMPLAVPALRRQASLQATAAVLQTRAAHSRAPVHAVVRLQTPMQSQIANSAMVLPESGEKEIEAGFVGVLGTFEIYRGSSGGHRMANLRVILR